MNRLFARTMVLSLVVAASTPSAAGGEAGIYLGASDSTSSGAAFEASVRGGLERLEEDGGWRLEGAAEATAFAEGGFAGGAGAGLELSSSLGDLRLLASAGGGLEFDEAGTAWSAEVGGLASLNGFALSASLAPRLSWDGAEDGGSEAGLFAGLSFLAGDVVLKPGLDLAWAVTAAGDRSLAARPGIGFSWYPGFPLSVSAEAGWRRDWMADGATVDTAPLRLSAFGALGERLFLAFEAGCGLVLATGAVEEALVSAEATLFLGSFAGGEARLPLRAAWDSGLEGGLSLSAGIEISFD